MPANLVIIDYGMGNLRSILRRFERINVPAEISGDPVRIAEAGKLILPGVGHFANGMKNLKNGGMIDILNEKVLVKKTPILGICLGMQLFANFSEEGYSEGLGWIDSSVVRFHVSDPVKFKVPHIGWNSARPEKQSRVLENVPENSFFYFVHSYHMVCNANEDVLTTTNYDYDFTSAVEKDNIFGTQFHPEKSFEYGLTMLKNFANL